jgi:hypothetical protein
MLKAVMKKYYMRMAWPGMIGCLYLIIFMSSGAYCQYKPSVESLEKLSAWEQTSCSLRFPAPVSGRNTGSNYNLIYDRFTWYLDPDVRYISGSVVSYFIPVEPGVDSIGFQLYHGMTVDSIIFHGAPVSFDLTPEDELRISLGQQLTLGVTDSVAVWYRGVPPVNSGYGSFTQSSHDGTPILWTFSEPYGAQDWWPCKNDLSDKIDSIDIIVTTPSQYRVAGNGLLVGETTTGDNKTFHWKHRYPIAAYLVAVAVTNYVAFSDYVPYGSDSIEILNYVFPEDLQTIQGMTPDLVPVMELYNDLLIPYPFLREKYGQAEWLVGGGMEHQTMTFTGNFGHEIMAHELAHQWFGDMVTLATWHDIWLNEGYATYMMGITYEHLFEGYYWPIWKSNNISYTTSSPGGSVYCDDTTSLARIFDPRLSYSKGAMILHLLRWIIGDSAFFAALQSYLSDPLLAYRYATVADAKRHFEEAAGRDLTPFFNEWYYGQGYPVYSIICSYKDQNRIEVTVNQTTSDPSVAFFELPLPIQFIGTDGDTLMVFDNTYPGQTFLTDPGFHTDSVFFDPDLRIITRNSSIILGYYGDLTTPDLLVFPNPSTGAIYIRAGEQAIDRLELAELNGRICFAREVLIPSYTVFHFDPGTLSRGIYFVRAYHGGQIFTRKVIRW